jgi:hypothetical protein
MSQLKSKTKKKMKVVLKAKKRKKMKRFLV